VFAVGLAVGLVCREPPVDASTASGKTIAVVRPTGEFWTGADGSGEPQAKTQRVTLRVVKRQGEATRCPTEPAPWHLTINGVTYVATPLDD
jgi:hypothetical protein